MALGYEISKIIIKNKDLTQRIINILDKAINLESALLEKMIQDPEKETVESKSKIVEKLKDGINEGLKRNNDIPF